jgi:Tfp pilus assembly protein PilV
MTPSIHPAVSRRGFTLLEVLVACGILVVSLASIAAMLPAAASRLSEATAMDRAAVLTSLAMNDLQIRGLATPAIFPTGTCGIVVGDGVSTVVAATVTQSGVSSPTALHSGTLAANGITLSRNGRLLLSSPVSAAVAARADTTRGFFLEDSVQYLPPNIGNMPRNVFIGVGSGTGYRSFTSSVTWGAVITPEPWGMAATGTISAVRASIAVFSKPSTARAMTLAQRAPNLFTTGTWPGAIQRTRLKPCSAVLAIPLSATPGQEPPQWLGVRSSWTSSTNSVLALGALTSGSAAAFVVFDRPPPPSMVVSGSLTVLTFDNLLSTDQKILPIR